MIPLQVMLEIQTRGLIFLGHGNNLVVDDYGAEKATGKTHNFFSKRSINQQVRVEKEMNRIEKRALEAQAIAPVIAEVAEKLGKEQALEIVRKINQREAFQRGQKLAEDKGENGIEVLIEDVATWGEGGKWEMEVLEQTSRTYFFNVLRCPYYEKYRDLGVEEIGVELSCCRDEPFARGLNPLLRLVRTKTIMEGADCCDFKYYLDDD